MGILRADRITGLGGANAIKGSVKFTSGGSLEINLDGATIGTSNFTLEAWVFWFGDYYHQLTGTESTNFNLYINNDDGDLVFYDGSTTFDLSSSNIKPNEWTHIALVREGTSTNETKVYINGTNTQNITVATNFSFSRLAIGAANFVQSNVYGNGYTSNLRFTLDAVYTSAFTPPNNELTLLDNTIVLCCQSPGNIFQEATGKTISSFRNSLNSADAQASHFTPNSPVGFSTTTDVGSQYGSTFDGFGTFATSTYMVPPGGNTRERNRGRALLGGGHDGSAATNHIHQLSIQSQGNTEDFGDLTIARWIPAPSSSSTRGVWSGGGGYNPGSPTGDYVNFIDFVTIASSSNATDFGDQTAEKGYHTGLSNETRGIIAGGYNDSVGKIDVIEYITIATAGNAQDFGDLTAARMQLAAAGSPTRGLFFGGAGNPNVLVDVIDYITIATTGNATDFGDMTAATKYGNATSSNTRAIYAGGLSPNDTTYVNVIQFVTIASTGNATDFGDLTTTRSTTPGATSNNIRGIFAGGFAPGNLNSIDFVTIATTGNASDFGDINFGLDMRGIGALSDSHGGLS